MSGARSRVLELAAALVVLALPSCGSGGGPNPPSTLPPATTPPTTQAPSGSGPTLSFTVDKRAGKSPLTVGFDLCASRDGNGGTSLTYLADFEEAGSLVAQGGCGFTHVYKSNGVTVRETKLAVRDSAGRQADGTTLIKSYVDVSITVDKTTGCNKTVIATAQLLKTASRGVRALADVDRVQFEAFNAAGQSVAKRDGTKQSGDKWSTGTWNVNDSTKLRVRATVYAGSVAGDDTPEDTRPACGS